MLYKQGEYDHMNIDKGSEKIHLFFDRKTGSRLPDGSEIEIISFGKTPTTFDQDVVSAVTDFVEKDGKRIIRHKVIAKI